MTGDPGTWTRYELHERPAGGDPWGVWSGTGRWWHDRASAEAACVRVSEDYHRRWPDPSCRMEAAVVEVVSRVVRVFPPPEGGDDMTRRVKLPCAREAEVLRAILATLEHLGVPAWRNNTGAFVAEHNGVRRFVRFGQVGGSDVFAVLPGGRFCAIEAKRRGARPTPAQLEFLRMITRAGGLAFWAPEPAIVERVVKAALDNPRLRVELDDDGTQHLTDEEERS